MEKYNKLLGNITELVEKGLFASKDLRNEIEKFMKFEAEKIINKLNLVSREEFEVQKKIIDKLREKVEKGKKIKKNFKRAKKF